MPLAVPAAKTSCATSSNRRGYIEIEACSPANMTLSVTIPTYETGKPVLYVISVDPGHDVVPYTVKRRYNDFLKLARDVEAEMGEPVAVPPPAKPGLWESVNIEHRRSELEIMLTALVRVPDFAESLAVGNFLELYSHRRSAKPPSVTLDWVNTTTDISRLIGEARRAANISYGRQRIVQAKALINQLQRGLQQQPTKALGSGELARRQQQLEGYMLTLHQLEAKTIDGDPRDQMFGRASEPKPPRVLGETSETRKLNNSGLVSQQQEVMNEQDSAIEDMLITVARQKELGMAINTELQKQNELLDELDGDVHRVNARLNEARRKTQRLNR